MAEKKNTRERLKEITDSIEQGIRELFESDKYRRYLSVMSRFHRYSLNNTMLIYMQKPEATLVAGYNKWQDQFERHVKKGEKGIVIIAPSPYKKTIEAEKLDPATRAPMRDRDGKIIMEETEIEVPMFRPVKVFDVSQTEGKPLPELAAGLSGSVQDYEIFMEALRRSAPVPIGFENMNPATDGYFNPKEQRIAIRKGMSQVQTVSAAVHEITHSKLHNSKLPTLKPQWQLTMVSDGGVRQTFMEGFQSRKDAEEQAERIDWHHTDENGYRWNLEVAEGEPLKTFVPKDNHTQEVEAESVSYAVCQYYGIETAENSFGYIAGWSKGRELPELKASLETINKTAGELISDIDRNRREILMEKTVGRIEFLGTDGAPGEKVEYTDAAKFEADIKSETFQGAPIRIVLYEDKDGNVIPHDYVFRLDPPPKGFRIENPRRTREEKKSVMEQLKENQKQTCAKSAHRKYTEREI